MKEEGAVKEGTMKNPLPHFNKRAIRILLECCLVKKKLLFSEFCLTFK